MKRVILHSDCNSFYASVECLHHPEIRDKPVAVGGDVEARHGIILTKNQIAKKYNIKTGEALWQAKQKCPDLVIVPPNFPLYMCFSKMARKIYLDYTDQVEPFGFCDRNALRYLGIHSFRHLFASMLIASGLDPENVSAALGHTQVSTTLNIYSHQIDAYKARISNAIGTALPFSNTKIA